MSGVPSSSQLAAEVVAALRTRRETMATAESLTGGLVGATITGVPGASAVYRGGLIPYATELKAALVGVSPVTLAEDGPVAASTAGQLAQGTARACDADWGLATTGVAGPDSQDGHPVGQVFIAVAGPGTDTRVRVRELSLVGDREAIRSQTVAAVLALLLESLTGS
ncbi:MAG: CinA family protein [Microlunatus sp.]